MKFPARISAGAHFATSAATPSSVEGNGIATLADSTIGGDTNQWLHVLAAGNPAAAGLADVTLSNSTATGSALTDVGSVSNLTMIDSTWNLTGNSNVTNLVNDPSLIDFSPPVGDPTLLSSYKTLTVENYVGEGGQIALNTYLGTDGSPSDLLVIDGGTATGTTGLRFDNTTGPGALTTGDGILVVDAINGGTTAPGAFAGFAAAGPYDYLLYRGGSTERKRLVPAQHSSARTARTTGARSGPWPRSAGTGGTAALPPGGFALCGDAGDGLDLWPRDHRHAA